MPDTIAAIATPQAAGGIGIIRISGDRAIETADKVFRAKNGESLADLKGYTARLGYVCDSENPLDEAVALVFRSPRSYTGEDCVELSCHGGLYIMQRALRAVLDAGARPAQAGEFTKRAFLNGRLDLSQAQAVMDIISAQGAEAAKAALNTLDGNLSRKISGFAQVLISAAAHMSAWVDYPDEEIEELDGARLLADFTEVQAGLSEILSRFDSGMAVKNGIDTVIAGRPNVGKSTLMNLLSGRERSIVTDIAGTTRDVVEESVKIGNVTLKLSDTAGLRESDDKVEQIGVNIARKRVERAELILAVFDASAELSDEDKALLEICKKRPAISLINKSDLKALLDIDYIVKESAYSVFLSAKDGKGYDELEKAVESVLGTQNFDPSAAMLSNERQRADCLLALSFVKDAIDAVNKGFTMDAVNVSVDCAIGALLSITGQKASQAVVDEIFAQFCVGK